MRTRPETRHAASLDRLAYRGGLRRRLAHPRSFVHQARRPQSRAIFPVGPQAALVAARHLDGGDHLFDRYAQSRDGFGPHRRRQHELAVVGLPHHRHADGVLLRQAVAPVGRAHRHQFLRAALFGCAGRLPARLPRHLSRRVLQRDDHGDRHARRHQDRRRLVRPRRARDSRAGGTDHHGLFEHGRACGASSSPISSNLPWP